MIVALFIAGLSILGYYAYSQSVATTDSSSPTVSDDSTPDVSQQTALAPDVVSNAAPVGDDTEGNVSVDTTNWEQNITTDESTWPSGDKIWSICRAIAVAEGYNVADSIPFRYNNPGDVSDGSQAAGGPYASISASGSNVTEFPDAATGWNWLYQKISNHVNGKSTVYPATLTILQFAKIYAGNWQNWVNNVTSQLGVDQNSTFASYVNS
jgi:hypothetical protein